jgi:hypothetical protein
MPSMGAKKEGALVDLRVDQGALFRWARVGIGARHAHVLIAMFMFS